MRGADRAPVRAQAAEPGRFPPLDGRADASAVELLQGLLREMPGLISDRVELFSLEVSRAGQALAKIVALTVAVAILGVTIWLALWAAVVMGLVALGLHWAVAFGVVIAVNVGAVAWALMHMRSLSHLLALPATRRHLTLSASAQAVAARSVPVSADGAGPELSASTDAAPEDAHASPDADDHRRTTH